MNFYHNNLKSKYKTPFGCIKQNEPCTINLEYYEIDVYCAKLILEHEDGKFYKAIDMTKKDKNIFTATFKEKNCGLYYYFFIVNEKINIYKDNFFDATTTPNNKWQITCYDENYDTPLDFKGKIYYQIFPDRFFQYGNCDVTDKLKPFYIHNNKNDIPFFQPNNHQIVENNDFYGGNLQGIIKKLAYLKELKVSIIYLNPIFMAYSNHRYDTADYLKIDNLLGNEQDFKALCDKAHSLNIKIILDGVFSHTGCNSVYFDKYGVFKNGAYNNINSPYFEWYQFKNNSTTEYTSWWGIDTLPCTNETNPNFMNFIINKVIPYWINLGADGFRLDVADELPDKFIKELNKKVKSINKNTIVIGEVWEDASNKISYSTRRKYFTDLELDSVMNYPFREDIIKLVKEEISIKDFLFSIMTIVEHYPKPILDCVMNSLSTHDTMRILTTVSDINFNISKTEKSNFKIPTDKLNLSFERLKLAIFLQFTLCGCACIYYGDEIGMQGFEDPFNREFFKWDNIDYKLLEFYKSICNIKNSYKSLQIGNFKILDYDDKTFSFSRQFNNEKCICIVSLSNNFNYCYNGDILFYNKCDINKNNITIHKYGFILIKNK